MGLKVKKSKLIAIWGIILSISIAFRCNPLFIYQNSGIEYILLILTTILALFFNTRYLRIILSADIFIGLTILCFVYSPDFNKYIFFIIICILYFYSIQKNYIEIKYIKYPLIGFALFTSIVTWISFFFPTFYTNNILSMFPEGSSLVYSFTHRNMYHGFTNHYSRNSYYIIVGILFLFSSLLSDKKYKKIKAVTLAFLMCTQFLVAKRGPTLFLIISLLYIVIKKESDINKKLVKSFKFIVLGVILFILAYIFVPGVDNLINRILEPNSSEDISSSRFYLWGVAWKMFINSPILGNGWGSYLKEMSGTTFQGAHNDYFQLLAENGIIGFFIIVIGNLCCLYYSSKVFNFFKKKEYEGTFEQKWTMFSYSFQIFILLYALTGMPHYSYEQYGLYLMLSGFSVGLYKINYKKIERGN